MRRVRFPFSVPIHLVGLLFTASVFSLAVRADGIVKSYEINVRILPQQGILQATAAVTLVAPEGGLRDVRFLLNRALTVTSVGSDNPVESYTFDRTKPSGHRYTPTGAPLTVRFAQRLAPATATVLRLDYQGPIEPDSWNTNFIKPDWTELAYYVAWYPYDPGSNSFTSRVSVLTEAGWPVTGTGVVRRSGQEWILTQDQPSKDIIVITAPKLHVRKIGGEEAGIEVSYANLSEGQADRIAADAGKILADFRSWLGPLSNKTLRIVFAERTSGGGYYRPGFMTLIWEPDYQGLVRYAAHETAHFWWCKGRSTTWEDWLNESFAEYSALLLVRQWYGAEAFEDYLSRYRKEAEDVPPIWGLDRNDKAAFAVLYRKGPILLNRLEEQIGKTPFRELLATLAARGVSTTDRMLATLEKQTSKDVRAAFEQWLKQ